MRNFHLYFIKMYIQTQVGKKRSVMASTERDSSSRQFSTESIKEQLSTIELYNVNSSGPKPLHSTTHLLTMAPTHIFMYSCVYQNLAAYIAIFSL